MALLEIIRYPDPRLHQVAEPVTQVDDAIRKLVSNMAETMYAAPGIGLAATQVNIHQQIIVIDVSEKKNALQVFINPRIVATDGMQTCEEGCLSVPGIFEKVNRPENVTVEALDANGKPFTLSATGLLSVCIQHEIDHLKGKVFVEYLSQLKQTRIKHKLKKQARETM